jgi:cell division control protein 7
MSALHAAPGVFELQRSSSFQEPQALKPQYTLAEEDDSVSQGAAPQEESEFEEEVDESVREDMRKLEDTFPGISDRFRLVNRIGEGMISSSYMACLLVY